MLLDRKRADLAKAEEANRVERSVPGSAHVLVLCGYGSIPINTIFSGMNIHLPAILGFTRYQGFDPSPYDVY